jgi:hypothetical protein
MGATTRLTQVVFKKKYSDSLHAEEADRENRSMEMGLIGCPEMSMRNYHYTMRNNPEERSSVLTYTSNLYADEADREQCLGKFCKQMRIITEITHLSWINRNKEPSNKAKSIFISLMREWVSQQAPVPRVADRRR